MQSVPGTFDRIAVPMFFADTVRIKAGQEITIQAEDNVALYDFLIMHTNGSPSQTTTDWRTALPPIIHTNHAVDIPMGFDFVYLSDVTPNQRFYEGVMAPENPHAETLPLKRLDEIFHDVANPILSRVLYTNIYDNPGSPFMIDPYFEFYENYTWSGVYNANRPSIMACLQENYFTMRTTSTQKTIAMPSVPGMYWIWIVARDRGAQDSYLFDYENNRVNVDPLTGNTPVYPQDVQLHQNNRFLSPFHLENPNVFYENSDSEADAPMVVLLRLIVEDHSMEIQRLDIHEPDLVSYPYPEIVETLTRKSGGIGLNESHCSH